MSDTSPAALLTQLDEISAQIEELSSDLLARRRNEVRTRLTQVIGRLRETEARLDPIHQPLSFFDPSDPRIIGKFIGLALLAQPRVGLSDLEEFYGSGVYALYYEGDFPQYQPIRGTETPVYVGKADPADGAATTPKQQGIRLHRRLQDHARSIGHATNVNVDDFVCRYLVVQSGWQTAAEAYLIDVFRPVWNNEVKLVYGIGKHGDSAKTRANKRSPWDTMHPGRAWAYSDPVMKDQVPLSELHNMLDAHFAELPPFKDTAGVLERFFTSLRQVLLAPINLRRSTKRWAANGS